MLAFGNQPVLALFLASRFLLSAGLQWSFVRVQIFLLLLRHPYTGRPVSQCDGCSHIHTNATGSCHGDGGGGRWCAGSSWTRWAAESGCVFVVFSGLRNFSAAPVLQLFPPANESVSFSEG